MNKLRTNKFGKFLTSPWFFWGVIVFFAIEALWIVFSAIYPMAFDEDFHFGLIKIYSQHWSPFLAHQPSGANVYGAIARDPSYLYQYLMSFPYRFIELFTKDQTLLVIYLRLINVALFAFSLVLFRKLLIKARVTAAFTNFIMLIFVLVPIVPLLAATINYDNLVMILFPWVGLLMAKILSAIKRKDFPVADVLLLAIVCLLGSLVKYAFLTVALGCVVFICLLVAKYFGKNFGKLLAAIRHGWSKINFTRKLILLVVLLLSTALFSQRYLVNVADYKTPLPKCNQVLSTQDCMAQSTFARSYVDSHSKPANFNSSIFIYIPKWFYGMWFRSFFVINGNVSIQWWSRYQAAPPVLLPGAAAILLLISSFILVLIKRRQIFKNNSLLKFLLFVTVLYVLILFLNGYQSYIQTGKPVAINGRYLLPVILPVSAIAACGWQLALRHKPKLKKALSVIVLLLFLEGGGAMAFILGSNWTWYWQNQLVTRVNYDAQNIAKKLVPFYNTGLQSP